MNNTYNMNGNNESDTNTNVKNNVNYNYNKNGTYKCFSNNITELNILNIMKKIKSNCIGYDNIKPYNIKKHKSSICKILTNQINYDIKHSNYPDILKNIKIIPIYKGGDKDNPTNYRPLCITSYFVKFMITY